MKEQLARNEVERESWGSFLGLMAGCCLIMGLMIWMVRPVQSQQSVSFTPTHEEALRLENMQLRLRAMNAEYQAARNQLLLEEHSYVSDVMAAHPDAQVTFDMEHIAWVRRVGVSGASGGK